MPEARRLVLTLERRSTMGVIALGRWDLTVPALFSIEDGSIAAWMSGSIPSSSQLSLFVTHPVRRAAWDGCLHYTDPSENIERFVQHTRQFPSIANLIERTHVLASAEQLRQHAETLKERVLAARPVASSGKPVADPVTGEITAQSLAPVAFDTVSRSWAGIDPRELYDFTLAMGRPDAQAFLNSILDVSQGQVRDIERLNDAILTLAQTRDISLFETIIQSWNDEQNVALDFGDYSRLVTDDGIDGYRAAIDWCDEYVRSAWMLEDSLKEFLFDR